MKEEISNKTLAFLLVGAIVVSLFGTFISLNRLDRLEPGLTGITGMYSDAGTVDLVVSGDISFTITKSVDFGTIEPMSGVDMNITTDHANEQAGTANNDCTTVGGSCDCLEIENDGNTVINLSFNSSEDADSLIGGTNPTFGFYVRNGDRNGAASNPGCNGAMWYNRSLWGKLGSEDEKWQEITADTNYTLCNTTEFRNGLGFNYTTGNDYISIEFNLTIPDDAVAGTKSADIWVYNNGG